MSELGSAQRSDDSAPRLQLGASRLEYLQSDTFLDASWVHLGDPEPDAAPLGRFDKAILFAKQYGLRHLVREALEKATSGSAKSNEHDGNARLYELTSFRPWYYTKGDVLDFDDRRFEFIFSEHFLEHLFFDEAIALLKECWRVLDLGGVIRTVVPDADLRVDLPPEPLGFPGKKVPWTHPQKHKTRWSVYMLEEALRGSGFTPVAVRFCDKNGQLHLKHPGKEEDLYRGCKDIKMIRDLAYIRRSNSLIVDGVKASQP